MFRQFISRIDQYSADEERAMLDYLAEEAVNNDGDPDRRRKRRDNAILELTLHELNIRPLRVSSVEQILDCAWFRIASLVVCAAATISCVGCFMFWLIPQVGELVKTQNGQDIQSTAFICLGLFAAAIATGILSGFFGPGNRVLHTVPLSEYVGGLSTEAERNAASIRSVLPDINLTVQYISNLKRRCLVATLGFSDEYRICRCD